MTDGAFQTKFAGDLFREEAKEDELRNEVTPPENATQEQQDAAKEAGSQRVEDIRGS